MGGRCERRCCQTSAVSQLEMTARMEQFGSRMYWRARVDYAVGGIDIY